jgi:hypothetical protein
MKNRKGYESQTIDGVLIKFIFVGIVVALVILWI